MRSSVSPCKHLHVRSTTLGHTPERPKWFAATFLPSLSLLCLGLGAGAVLPSRASAPLTREREIFFFPSCKMPKASANPFPRQLRPHRQLSLSVTSDDLPGLKDCRVSLHIRWTPRVSGLSFGHGCHAGSELWPNCPAAQRPAAW